MNESQIAANVARCRARLGEASARYGAPELLAVTKTMPPEVVNLVYAAGVARIGENRVQELLQKLPALNRGFTVELIGQLQTNKVKYIVDCVSRVQSLDRMALAQELDRRCQARGRAMPCLVQVNIGREAQKGGIPEDELLAFVRQAARLKGIAIEGLMAVAPIAGDAEQVRPYFRRMRAWFERLQGEAIAKVNMDTLSMGMSGDYVVAAEEGATLVRLGSAIFGSRSIREA
ncbi:MAG: YggS family pyridoxal phosphate-dependent enzyme [Eubacteriales bacterium]|nr:YggS family pyridoxal phosphate-dependent enzyme [Christensenellaceae bacterium]MEA5065384.1 YggS family pyridoxal phosphate-dependent enzyme [Eubacteriales bacterium]